MKSEKNLFTGVSSNGRTRDLVVIGKKDGSSPSTITMDLFIKVRILVLQPSWGMYLMWFL